MINGSCYHEAVLRRKESKRAESDPLCAQWRGNKCLKCVAGTYMNLKGECKMEDPNCQKYDYESEVCKICMRGYHLRNNVCARKY